MLLLYRWCCVLFCFVFEFRQYSIIKRIVINSIKMCARRNQAFQDQPIGEKPQNNIRSLNWLCWIYLDFITSRLAHLMDKVILIFGSRKLLTIDHRYFVHGSSAYCCCDHLLLWFVIIVVVVVVVVVHSFFRLV